MIFLGILGKTNGHRVNIALVKMAILVGRSLGNPGIVIFIARLSVNWELNQI
jgi:hypothetical protein